MCCSEALIPRSEKRPFQFMVGTLLAPLRPFALRTQSQFRQSQVAPVAELFQEHVRCGACQQEFNSGLAGE